jgi:hypothetical protein
MSMFDTYKPSTRLCCSVCGHPLEEWQGKDGPCALFVWMEGRAAPVAQDTDHDIALSLAEREAIRLPETFTIYFYDCSEHRPVEARCRCVNGIWAKTDILPYRMRG